MKKLNEKIAVVTGATRGCGRGIAVELGAAGATVYCTGRSTRGGPTNLTYENRPETIDETAEMVTAAGGVGIAVQVDHTRENEVAAFFQRVQTEQNGKLDILVNDIWGGESLTEWGVPFWEMDVEKGRTLLERAIFTHILTSRYAVPLMVKNNSGLIFEIGDGDGYHYRGSLFYSLAKVAVVHLAEAMAADFKEAGKNITALAVTPGWLRSEIMLAGFGVTEDNWRDVIAREPDFAKSETPRYIGRAVVALASDPNIHAKAGKALATWNLTREYGFTDVDGTHPHWDESSAMKGENE